MSSLDGNFSKFLPSFVCRLSLLVIAVLVRWVERVSRLVIIWHPGYGIATAAEKGLRTAAVVMEGAERLSFESPPRDGFVGGIFALGGIGLGYSLSAQANLVEPHIAIEHAYLNPRGVKPRRQLRLRGYDNSVG